MTGGERKAVSVIMATYNRSHLLWRSLACYSMSMKEFSDFEIIVLDDGSTDSTRYPCKDYSAKLDIKYVLYPRPSNVEWRDGASIINFGLRAASGNLIIQTHPEVMPGLKSIKALWEASKKAETEGVDVKRYFACRPYYLNIVQQMEIDTVQWNIKGPIAVRDFPNFYGQSKSPTFDGHPDYTPESIETIPNWESFVFGGMTRRGWRAIGGIPACEEWGSVDLSFHGVRIAEGIRTVTMPPDLDEAYCVHQNHDDPKKNVVTPRNMEKAHAGAVRAGSYDNIMW